MIGLGVQLKRARQRLDFTQGEVARAVGLTQPRLSEIERGMLPKPWEFDKLIEFFNLDIDADHGGGDA